MKESLRPGLTHTLDATITADMSPPHLAPIVVLSTPKMVELMEMASLQAVVAHLDPNETTVGTLVNVSHEAAAGEGAKVIVTSELTNVAQRRLTFSVSAQAGERMLGRGTHERVVVDTSRFG